MRFTKITKNKFVYSVLAWCLSLSLIVPNIPLYANSTLRGVPCLLTGIELTDGGIDFLWRPQGRKRDVNQIREALSLYYTALAIPTKNWWVDLYLWNTDKQVLGNGLDRTELGNVLVKSDLELKRLVQQILNSDRASEFWETVDSLGSDFVSPRFWIEPGRVIGVRDKDTFKIYKAKLCLRVAVENPRIDKRDRERLERILMRLVVPPIEKELNSGEVFSSLRAAYYAMLLAAWTKEDSAMPTELLRVKDSYMVPDVGQTQVNTYGYLIKFCRELLSNRMDLSSVVFLGGGGRYEKIPKVIKDGIKGAPEVELDEVRQKGERKVITDIPIPNGESDSRLKAQVWENKASKFGLDPSSVFIFGKIHFSGVDPKEIIGSNVVIANLSKDELIIDKEFVCRFAPSTKGHHSKLFYSLIVKHDDGKVQAVTIPGITKTTDVVGIVHRVKSLFDSNILFGEGNILFLQHSGQGLQEGVRDKLKAIEGINVFLVSVDKPTLIPLEQRLLYPFYVRVSEEKRKGVIDDSKVFADWIVDLLSSALTKATTLHEVEQKLTKILDTHGRYIDGKFVKLNGRVVNLVDRKIVEWLGIDSLSEVQKKWLLAIRKKFLNYMYQYYEEAFRRYIRLDKAWAISEQLETGRDNLKRMLSDSAVDVFADVLAKYRLHISNEEFLPDIFGKLSKVLLLEASDKERNIVENISFANSLSDLEEVLEQIENVNLSSQRKKEIITLIKLKGLVIFEEMATDLFSKVIRKLQNKVISPDATNMRLAYYPLQGRAWDIESIIAILKILATGQVDRVILTVSKSQMKKSSLTSNILSASMLELLKEYIFGSLVEFSDVPFEDLKYFDMPDEEVIPDMLSRMSLKLKKDNRRISDFYYVIDSREYKVAAPDIRDHSVKTLIRREISYLNKRGIPLDYDDTVGLFYQKESEKEDSEVLNLLTSTFSRERLRSVIEEVLSEIGVFDDIQKILHTKEEQVQVLSQLPLVLAKLSELEDRVKELEEKQIKMSKTLRNFLRSVGHLYSGYNCYEEEEDTHTPDKVGGLMLSQVNLVVK